MSKIIAPASKPQELFLTIRDEYGDEVDIVFYGGKLAEERLSQVCFTI